MIDVTEQHGVISELDEAGILAGVRWAYESAVNRALEVLATAGIEDPTLLGVARHVLFRDRLDRVFGCDLYAPDPALADPGLDVLYESLPQSERDSFPTIAPGVVTRRNLKGSPGWSDGRRRLLLAAGEVGRLHRIPWPSRSLTKQRVADQPDRDHIQLTLFDQALEEESAGLVQALQLDALDMDTFVIAHSLELHGKDHELIIGRPRSNPGGGEAWYWWHDLLGTPPSIGGLPVEDPPMPSGPDPVPDAHVSLRRPGRTEGRTESDAARPAGRASDVR